VLAKYILGCGPPPRPFYLQGDVDCSGRVDYLDAIRLARYLYGDGWLHGWPCEYWVVYYLDTTGLTEAQIMAMWYAETLEPPDSLTARFRSDLARVRNELTAYEPALDGLFYSPHWPPSMIYLRVDSMTAQAIADSTYHAWDSLNLALQLDALSVYLWREGQIYVFRLYFSGLKNPSVLASAYADLPGVQYASTGWNIGERSHSVWPHVKYDTATYLLTQGWGDCPSGCLNKRFYYVVATPDSMWFVGSWLRISGAPHNPPEWWPQACENLQRSPLHFLCE
jgi:hypothetical protein